MTSPFAHGVAAARTVLLWLILALALSGCTTSTEVLEARQFVEQQQPTRFAAIVVDGHSGRTLFSENASSLRYPASLTKMMTLYMLFEALETGRISKESEIPVSAHAAGQPPSKLGIKAGTTISVDTAIRALAVKSANDVAVAVAEYLGGTEDQFASMMTAKARSLGMTSTRFANASGLNDPRQVTTAFDMAKLGLALRRRFPAYFGYFSLRSFSDGSRTIAGHNKALDMIAGADGIKTGYTRASGFNLVTSVSRSGKLMVAVILGEDSARTRDARMAAMVQANFAKLQ